MLYTVLYLAIVWAGPRLMKNREPFRLTWALIPYNLSMAALNFYIASEVSDQRSTKTYRLGNNRHSHSTGTVSIWSLARRREVMSTFGSNLDKMGWRIEQII